MSMAETLAARLGAHAATQPDRTALIFLDDPQDPASRDQLTYRQLDEAARALATALRARFAKGDRMLLLYPPSLHFAVAFVACQYGGFVAVPAPLPDGQRHRSERLAGVVENSGAAAVLTVSAAEPVVLSWMKEVDRTDLPCLGTDQVEPPDPAADPYQSSRTTNLTGPDVAFLQYTSGSTAAPRGAIVTQTNLAANVSTFLRMLNADRDTVFGGWLPMHHDMGLVGQLATPLYAGATTVMMAPSMFLRHPGLWLRMIGEFGLYMSAAPNFAYDLCTRRVSEAEIARLDLSSWRVAAVASEPVLPRTVEAFARRFAPAGLAPTAICPGYGLAESTMVVSMSPPDQPMTITPVDPARLAGQHFVPLPPVPVTSAPDAASPRRRLVGCGPISGCELRIVEPESRIVLAEGQIGEIWLRGPSVAGGYWRNVADTAKMFNAATADGQSGFLRTGDLGVCHDGQLYVTGRIKEVLIVRGQNLYPQDLEAEARLQEDALAHGVGAAFTVAVPEEEIVVVHECRGGRKSDSELAALARRVQLRLTQEFGVTTNVVLVRPGAIPRTTSGKIQRRLARDMFLAGKFTPTAEQLTLALREQYRPVRSGRDNTCRVRPTAPAPTTCAPG